MCVGRRPDVITEIYVASRDDRIRCLAVQLAFANGERVVTGKMSEEEKARFLHTLRRLEERRARTGKETMVPLGDSTIQFATSGENMAS